MKRIIFCLFLACTTLCYAESNYPTVRFSTSEDPSFFPATIRLDVFYETENGYVGKTYGMENYGTIDGREYVCVRTYTRNGAGYLGYSLLKIEYQQEKEDSILFFQDGDKIYCLPSKDSEASLVLDYDLKEGDEYVSGDGQHFNVVETGYFEEYAKDIFYNLTNEKKPKMLRLLSDDGNEDVWIEGLGSINWGIVPLWIVEKMKGMNGRPRSSKLAEFVDFRTSETIIDEKIQGLFNVNVGDYWHAHFYPQERNEVKDEDYQFYFEGDTLVMTGVWSFHCASTEIAVELIIDKDNVLAWNLDEVWYWYSGSDYARAEVRLPGFKPGTYKLYQGDGNPLILVCEGSSKEENYVPIIQQNKLWKVGRYVLNTDPAENLSYYYFDGDTVSVGLLYSKMMCATLTKEDAKMTYMGGVRENGKRVYILPFGMEKEYLMYDFGAHVGDTLEVYCPESTQDTWTFLVVGKDSIESGAGKLCRLSLAPWQAASETFGSPSCVWIEGVGSDRGPCAGAYKETPYGMYRDIVMSCVVDETTTLYTNEILAEDISPNWEWLWKEVEDAIGSHNVKKQKLDFTHVVKTKPIRNNAPDATSLEGEYDNVVMGLGFFGLDGTYVLTITDEGGAALFSRSLSTEALLSMDILLNSYADGEYTITVENDAEAYVGHFSLPVLGEGIQSLRSSFAASGVYDLSGRRVDAKAYENGKLKKGIYIKDGWKMVIK